MRNLVVSGLCLLLLAGCSAIENKVENAKLAIGSPSDASRCAAFMNHAYPGAAFNITATHFSTTMTTSVVNLQAVRTNVPASSSMRHVAAQCRFDHGVIVDFHWTENPLGRMG